MLFNRPAAPAAPIVARKTQPGPGSAALGFALGVHATLVCLLLQGHAAPPVAPPVRPIEVTLELASPDAAAPAALPELASMSALPDPVPPARDPERTPTLPDPAEAAPVPDAAPPSAAMGPDVAAQRVASPPASQQPPAAPRIPPSPPRHAPVKPETRRPTTHAVRARKAEPDPDAAPSPPSATIPALSAQTPQAVPAPQQPPSPEAVGAWRSALSAWLRGHRTYPEAARRDGAEGRVVVRFTIDGAGRVIAVTLVDSSGSAVLDEAAEALLRGAHLPAPPTPALNYLSVTLPISYTLAQ